MPRPETPAAGRTQRAAVIVLTCQLPGEAAGQELFGPRMFRLEVLDCPGKAPKRAVVVGCASFGLGAAGGGGA